MAGGKKSGRKAAASAAAHAASKHKTSSVAISAATEARVRDAIAVSAPVALYRYDVKVSPS